MGFLPYAIGAWLFLCGLYGVATSRNLIHLIMCLGIMQSSTYVIILAIGYRAGAIAPVFYDKPLGTPAVDPVSHALMLTDVVVEATVTAVLLALTVKAHERTGTIDPDEMGIMRG